MTFIKTRLLRLAGSAAFVSLLVALSVGALPVQAQEAGQRLPTVTLSAGMHNIVAELARTPREREIGLMFRKQMAVHEGMLFVFEEPATQCFWMRNTYLPLSAAFVDDEGRIVNVEDMAPLTETSHCSSKPVRYVLEMNQGWFAKRGLKSGFKLTGPMFR